MRYLCVKMMEVLNKVEILKLEFLGFMLDCRMSYGGFSRSYLEQ